MKNANSQREKKVYVFAIYLVTLLRKFFSAIKTQNYDSNNENAGDDADHSDH